MVLLRLMMNIQEGMVKGTQFGCKHTVETLVPTAENLGPSEMCR